MFLSFKDGTAHAIPCLNQRKLQSNLLAVEGDHGINGRVLKCPDVNTNRPRMLTFHWSSIYFDSFPEG